MKPEFSMGNGKWQMGNSEIGNIGNGEGPSPI
jgi:hypothetical protein